MIWYDRQGANTDHDIRRHRVSSNPAHKSNTGRRRRRVWRIPHSVVQSYQGDSWDRRRSRGRIAADQSVIARYSHTENTADERQN